MKQKTSKNLIGIDEAGRGPLAGPVAIGVVMLFPAFNIKLLKGIKDSKVLTEQQREEWFKKLVQWKKSGTLDYSVALISASIIDTKGISYAIKQGIKNCLRKIQAQPLGTKILLDGSLKAPAEFIDQTTIIRGDASQPVISLAAISAKVTRDRMMKKIARKYPFYGFEQHKGYGTLAHRKQIKALGPTAIHRMSFLKNILSKKATKGIL